MSDYVIKGADGREYGPVDETKIHSWMQEGRANASTEIRKDGGAWTTVGALPEFGGAAGGGGLKVKQRPAAVAAADTGGAGSVHDMLGHAAHGGDSNLVQNLASCFSGASGWLKFLAILAFLYAALAIVSTFGVGIIFAWIPIWMGVLMWKAASRTNTALVTGSADEMGRALASLKTFFVLNGVLVLLSILLPLIFFLIMIFVMGASLPEMIEQMEEMQRQQMQ